MDKIISMLKECERIHFYGTISASFRDGEVQPIRREQTIRPGRPERAPSALTGGAK